MRIAVLVAGVMYAACLLAQEPQAPAVPGAKPAKPEPAPVKPEDKCSVAGNIYSLKTGEPLKKAEVQMHNVEANSMVQFGATTDIAGRFKIENLDPGKYNLTASRNGYVTTSYGGKGKPGTGTMITLSPGTKLKDIAVKLPVQGVVTGRVIDEDGEPMANVRIQLMQQGYMNGKKTLWPMASGSTNDKGEYRVFGVAPGKYYASANAMGQFGGWSQPEVRSDKGEQLSYAPTYYPNAASASEGALLDIVAGADLAGIDFRLVKSRSYKIAGKVTGGVSRNMGIQLIPKNTSGGSQWDRMMFSQTDDKGGFVFRGLRPGSYSLSASAWSEDGGKTAHLQVDVADSDVEGLQLAFGSNPDVAGLVRVDGGSELNNQQMRVQLATEDTMMGAGAEVKDDGTFKLRNVPLDRARLQVWPMPDGHYIKSIRAGDRDAPDLRLDFTEGAPGELVITLSAKAGTVTGSVRDSKDQAATAGVVVLVPDNRKFADSYFQTGLDQNGSYTLKNLRPGSYKLFAFDNIEYGSYQDPDWLKPFEDKGESIEVKESERSSKDLKLIVTDEGK
jgi:protocatechuate 3,4-dioxygenase beta subunit